jgi:type IV pilus assembly protein PilW
VTTTLRRESGFSLVELMIASAIGLLLLTGLSMIFINSSDANRELQKTAQQIENGRYAVEVLSQDLRLAGFYGHLYDVGAITAPGSVPDPCEDSSASALLSALWFPVQGYGGTVHSTTPASDTAADVSSTTCAALTSANLKAGSDVLVIRRADTNALAAADVPEEDAFYIQANTSQAEIQLGGTVAVGSDKKADGTTAATLKLTNGAAPAPAAPIRRLHVRVYFVAPCSVGSGTGGVCTGAAGEDAIPTLKRLELTKSGSVTLVPLVEGIDYLKIEYGIDDLPAAVKLETGLNGDATVDRFETAPSAAEWANVIAAKVHVLARNTEPTRGHLDDKTYTLGSVDVPARNDNFKRHVYTAAVYLANPAGRREVP